MSVSTDQPVASRCSRRSRSPRPRRQAPHPPRVVGEHESGGIRIRRLVAVRGRKPLQQNLFQPRRRRHGGRRVIHCRLQGCGRLGQRPVVAGVSSRKVRSGACDDGADVFERLRVQAPKPPCVGCPERMNRGVPAAGWIRDCCDIGCSPFHSPGNMSLVASTSGRVCSCWDRQRWKPLLPAAELIHCSPGVVADLTSQVPAGLSTGSGTLYPRTVDSPDSPPIPPCRAAPVLSHLGDCRCRTAVTRPGGYRFCSPMRTVTSPSRVWPRIRITR